LPKFSPFSRPISACGACGFIIGQDYGHRIAEFQQQMGRWVQEGKIKYREQQIDGLAPGPSGSAVAL
jgi:NADPH-dependent curcumin reductase CurA